LWRNPPQLPLPAGPSAWLKYLVSQLETKPGAVTVRAGDDLFDPMRGRVGSGGLTFASLGPIAEGERNEPVNRCIGSMVMAGLSEDEILAAGEQWAESQVPPYSLSHLRSKVRWCLRKHSLTGGGLWDDDGDLLATEEKVVGQLASAEL